MQGKDEYVRTVENKLSEYQAQIERMREKSTSAGVEDATQEERFQRMEEAEDAVRAGLEELSAAEGEAWKEMKVDVDEALREYKNQLGLLAMSVGRSIE